MDRVIKVTVIGGGAWGTALSKLAAANGHNVTLWSRQSSQTLAEAVSDRDAIVSAVSMKGVAATAAQMQGLDVKPNAILVSATKGLDPIASQTPSQIWQKALPHNPIVVLSGPNLSAEIMAGLPAATVVASTVPEAAQLVQTVFASRNFRIYTNSDPIGVELGGTLKNVIAIAVGVCDGLQLGANAKAALITRSLTEIIRVGLYFGAQPETFWGLSGLGDLLATCNSNLSRNYRVGYGLAQGKTLDRVLSEIEGTAEGVNTANVLIELANREGITVPVSRYVYRLLHAEITPQQAVEGLMERELKPELQAWISSDE
ncbi:NAD(P)H-dependent glycerol-3-phosphate dehydrogenase [Pseudanabaena sp. PCC 6802]|uniref:NAD(P)H-dependent glycerol-3-phosphate dehydrogenase n=1 Tax=Pseudanabaena sp. PCC 6802 TaxID=118173 RepID=UPI00034685FA|nr:NAD(P)H-dependent glycerol-3-phosphate dehydrogenase [Pseudanabaena sp. PCC 6802]